MKPTQAHFSEARHIMLNPKRYTKTLREICLSFLKQHGSEPDQAEPVTEQPCKPSPIDCYDVQGNIVTVDFGVEARVNRIMGW